MGNALLLLFRVSTGEDWPMLMRDYQKSNSPEH